MTAWNLAEYERLVRRIHAYNDVWHALRDGALGDGVDLSVQKVARAGKGLLQAELIRRFPEFVFLADHSLPDGSEPLYGVQLRERVAGYTDACHLPVRVARENLSDDEISEALARASLPPSHAGEPR